MGVKRWRRGRGCQLWDAGGLRAAQRSTGDAGPAPLGRVLQSRGILVVRVWRQAHGTVSGVRVLVVPLPPAPGSPSPRARVQAESRSGHGPPMYGGAEWLYSRTQFVVTGALDAPGTATGPRPWSSRRVTHLARRFESVPGASPSPRSNASGGNHVEPMAREWSHAERRRTGVLLGWRPRKRLQGAWGGAGGQPEPAQRRFVVHSSALTSGSPVAHVRRCCGRTDYLRTRPSGCPDSTHIGGEPPAPRITAGPRR